MNDARPLFVGVTGHAQHGKDTTGGRLVDRWGFRRFAFADQLKQLALRVDPWVAVAGLSDYPPARLSRVVEETGWEAAKAVPEVRRFLQELGTAVRDIIGADAWVRALGEMVVKAGTPERIVVTDVRFPNEAAYVHENGGVLVRVTRPNFENGVGTDHPSEKHVPHLAADYDVVNDASTVDLCDRVDAIAADLTEGFRPAR